MLYNESCCCALNQICFVLTTDACGQLHLLYCNANTVKYSIALQHIESDQICIDGGTDLVWRPNALSPPRPISSFTLEWFHPVWACVGEIHIAP